MLRPFALVVSLAALGCGVAAGPARADPDERRWAVQAVNASAAWKVTKGAGVTVAVLAADHPDADVSELAGRVSRGPDLAIGMSTPTKPGQDGTAVASVIAGNGQGDGIAGVAPEASILSVPVEEQRDGTGLVQPEPEGVPPADTPLARGIRYAVSHGASVICVPISRFGVRHAEREAVAYALSRGVVLVAAVGDGGESEYARHNGTSYWTFPAGYPGVVGVAAVDRKGRKAPSSSDNLSVLVAAPGTDVPVTLQGGERGTASGTGVASALVAGAAALIKAKYPDMAPELVARALTSTAHPHPANGYDDRTGFGVVDAAAALTKAGELRTYGRTATGPGVVGDDAHFRKGPRSGPPDRPGPDPVRLWIFGLAVLGGLAGFAAAIAVLLRR